MALLLLRFHLKAIRPSRLLQTSMMYAGACCEGHTRIQLQRKVTILRALSRDPVTYRYWRVHLGIGVR